VFRTPPRDRTVHAAQVLGSFQQAQAAREQFPQQVGAGFYESPGLTLLSKAMRDFP
jgi:hypothetical protein